MRLAIAMDATGFDPVSQMLYGKDDMAAFAASFLLKERTHHRRPFRLFTRTRLCDLKSAGLDIEPTVKCLAKRTSCWRGEGRYNSSRTGIFNTEERPFEDS
jgi:hypothetical protein